MSRWDSKLCCAEYDERIDTKGGMQSLDVYGPPIPEGVPFVGWCFDCANRLRQQMLPGTYVGFHSIIDATGREGSGYIHAPDAREAVIRLHERKPTAIAWRKRRVKSCVPK